MQSMIFNVPQATKFTRAEGFNLDFPYYYNRNTKLIDLCTNANYTSVAGTQSADGTNYKVQEPLGTGALKILENDNTAGTLYSDRNNLSLDLSKFSDGSASATTDYIYFVIYVSDVTKVGSYVSIRFGADATYNINNRFAADVLVASLATGYNYIKIAKSSCGKLGTVDWNSIQSIRLSWNSAINSQNAYVTFNLIQLVRKDPDAASPNPFQKEIDGVWTKDMAINAGEWYVGLESGELICRNMNHISAVYRSLYGIRTFSNFYAVMDVTIKSSNSTGYLEWNIDDSNKVGVNITNTTMTLKKVVASTPTSYTTTVPAISAGSKVRLKLYRIGDSFYAEAIINNNRNIIYAMSLSQSYSSVGTLAYTEVSSIVTNMNNMTITTTEHVHHADIAELAKEVENKWTNWTPTVAWTTGTPEGSVAQTARYTTMGNICFFNYSYTATDGNGATALTITLPVTPKDNNALISLSSQQKQNTTWTDPLAYIDDDSGGIAFRNLSICTDGQAVEVIVTGWYEI